jgi:hypothetical protein
VDVHFLLALQNFRTAVSKQFGRPAQSEHESPHALFVHALDARRSSSEDPSFGSVLLVHAAAARAAPRKTAEKRVDLIIASLTSLKDFVVA